MQKKNIPEFKNKNADSIAAETVFERVVVNWIECKAKCSKPHAKKELNWESNDKLDTCKHFWGINIKFLLDHLIKESGEERQFRFLP